MSGKKQQDEERIENDIVSVTTVSNPAIAASNVVTTICEKIEELCEQDIKGNAPIIKLLCEGLVEATTAMNGCHTNLKGYMEIGR